MLYRTTDQCPEDSRQMGFPAAQNRRNVTDYGPIQYKDPTWKMGWSEVMGSYEDEDEDEDEAFKYVQNYPEHYVPPSKHVVQHPKTTGSWGLMRREQPRNEEIPPTTEDIQQLKDAMKAAA
jgi:hypothetical protein